jgi:hypothetical protein
MGECWPKGWTKPTNVSRWENCYQSVPLRGMQVPGANNHFMGPVGHASVQNTPCVVNGIAGIVRGAKGPLTVANYKHVDPDSATRGSGGELPSTITGRTGSLAAAAVPGSARLARPSAPFKSTFGNPYAPGGFAAPGTEQERLWMERATPHDVAGGSVLAKRTGEHTRNVASEGPAEPIAVESTISERAPHSAVMAALRANETTKLPPETSPEPLPVRIEATESAAASQSPVWTGGASASVPIPSPAVSPKAETRAELLAVASTQDIDPSGDQTASAAEETAEPASLFDRIHAKLRHRR